MPELPEIETLRRALEPLLVGRRFETVEIFDRRLSAPAEPRTLAGELSGGRVQRVGRRGKYLLVEFDDERTLLVHLRMSGSLRHWARAALPEDPYRRALISLDDGGMVGYRDVRRFGTWRLLGPDELDGYLDARLGPEPLEASYGAAELGVALSRRRTPLKAAILDQRTVAGVGNIYADEALWRARLHPRREAAGLDADELRALWRGIRAALRRGIACQGSTLRDYAQPDGQEGRMQREFKVYGRGGEPCERCGTLIERSVVAGRGTWTCPACQQLTPTRAPVVAGRSRS
jgi:formamidopyrimidine-DNA glycosylase